MFNSASVIKIPVLVLAFQMADKGAIKLDERITIRKEDIRGGSGHFPLSRRGPAADVPRRAAADGDHQRQHRHRPGDREGRRRRARQRVVEGVRIRGWPAACVQTTGELFAKYGALAPADDRNAKTNADRSYWLGEITPARRRPDDRSDREEDDRLDGRLRRHAAHDARAAGRRAPAAIISSPSRSPTRPATSRPCSPTTSASSTRARDRSWFHSSAMPSLATTAKRKIASAASRSN